MSVQGDREPVSLSAAPFYFLNLKTMAGCRWKKSNERDREKKMHGPLLILAFLSRGWGGGGGETRGNFPKQRLAEMCLARSPIVTTKKKASRFVSCSLDEIHHHKNSMTDLTRPGSLPCEELQSYPFLKKAGKSEVCLAEEERQNFLAAALFPRKLCRSAA